MRVIYPNGEVTKFNYTQSGYLEQIIEHIIGENHQYQLMDTFNDQNGNLKSYVFFESEKLIVHFDFNKNQINNDLINFIKLSSGKRVLTIIFNTIDAPNQYENFVYYINNNTDNISIIKLFLSTKKKEQKSFDDFGVVDFLYNLDVDFYHKYLNELNRAELFKKI